MKRNLLFLLSLSLIVMTLSGCLFMTEVSGRVVDARSTDANPGLGGVSVTVETDGSSYTTSTNSNGDWSAMVWPGSSFTITYSKSGYYIPDMVTDLDSPVTTSSVVPAVPIVSGDSFVYDFVLVWDGSQDLDLFLSFPKEVYDYDNNGVTSNAIFNSPYENSYSTATGFGPLTSDWAQRYLFPIDPVVPFTTGYSYLSSEGIASINLNADTLLIDNTTHSNLISGNLQNGLDSGTYNWNGVGNVYVESSSTDGNISETEAVLYVFLANNGSVALRGVYPAPLSNDDALALSLLRINFFSDIVQLVPDTRVYPDGSDYFRDINDKTVIDKR